MAFSYAYKNGFSYTRNLGVLPKPQGMTDLGLGLHDSLSWMDSDDWMLSGLPTTTKTLTIPGKRWGSYADFLNEFPNLKTNLFIAIYPITDIIHKVGQGPAIPTWEAQKRIAVHTNIVRYAYAKEFPINFTSYIDPGYVGLAQNYRWWNNLTADQLRAIQNAENAAASGYGGAFNYQTGGTVYGQTIPPMPPVTTQFNPMGYAAKFPGWERGPVRAPADAYYWAFAKFAYPEAFASTLSGSQFYDIANNWINTYWLQLRDEWLPTYVQHFEAYSPEQSIEFSEVYGVTDPNQMAPYTISYIVTKDPPPVPDNAWNNVKFWSDLFRKREGMAILQAAAEKYPVKVKTPATAFKEDPSFYTRIESGEAIKYIFQYVFNDFDIEVTPDAKILVRYKRDARNETVEFRKAKESKWADYVGYAIAAIALTVATYGLATPLLAAAAPVAATAAPAAVPAVAPVAPVAAPALLPAAVPIAPAALPAGGAGLLQTIGSTISSALPVVKTVAEVAAPIVTTGLSIKQASETKRQLISAGAPVVLPPSPAPITEAGIMPLPANAKTLLLIGGFGIVSYILFGGKK